MLRIDLKDPPSWQDLDAEKQRLKLQRRKLIWLSLAADLVHGSIFLGLYLTDQLSGRATLLAIGFATLVATLLASRQKNMRRVLAWPLLSLVALATLASMFGILRLVMGQPATASSVAGLACASIILGGAVFGRQLLATLLGAEKLKTFIEDDFARQELNWLCQEYPLLARYRELASQNLRPNLTYLELEAMREWAATQPPQSISTFS